MCLIRTVPPKNRKRDPFIVTIKNKVLKTIYFTNNKL